MKCFNQLSKAVWMLAVICFLGSCAAGNISDATAADGSAVASTKKGKKVKKEEYSPVGEWVYDIQAPDGSTSGTMVIEGTPGTYEVVLKTGQFGEIRVYDLDMTGQSMSGMIDIAGNSAEIEGDFDGDTFSGALVAGDDVFPIEAIRTATD